MTDAPVPEPARAAPRRWRRRTRPRWFRARHEVLWLFLTALAIRAAAAWMNPAILNDSVALLRATERYGRDGISAALVGPDHPLVPWLLSVLPRWWDLETTATALSVFAGALAVWPLHVLARRACGRHAATAGCIVFAALPKAVGVSSVPLTSAFLLPLFFAGLAFAVAAGSPSSKRRRTARLVTAGLVCGFAYLCRPEGLVAAAGAVLAALVLVRRGRRLASCVIVAAAFLIVAAPYAILLSREAGRVQLSPKKDLARFVGVDPIPRETSEPVAAVHDVASALEGALTVPVFLLVLVGCFLPTRWRMRRSFAPRILLLGLAGVFVGLVIRLRVGWGYGGARHVLPGALLLLPFAGEGFHFLGAFLSRAIARRRLAVVLASYLAIPLAVKALLRPEGESMEDARRLGEAIAEASHPAPGETLVIASFREPVVAYYADRALAAAGAHARDLALWGSFRPLLQRSDTEGRRADLVAALRREGAAWLVLDLVAARRTQLRDTEAPVPALAKRLVEDGLLEPRVTSPGSRLAAFPVRQ